jgi:hypothetical protein
MAMRFARAAKPSFALQGHSARLIAREQSLINRVLTIHRANLAQCGAWRRWGKG